MELIEWINGITKLNKTTMNIFQNNIKETTDNLEKETNDLNDSVNDLKTNITEISKTVLYKETIIYNGGETNANFTLSETKENFDEIKVYYTGKTNELKLIHETETFEVVEGSQITELSTMWWSANHTILIETLGLTFDGVNVKLSHKNALEVGTDGTNSVITSKGSNYIRPYKVIGINKIQIPNQNN